MTIADYNEQIKDHRIVINHNYQRSDKVWPISAKSNLIDTILNGYPVPKIIISQTTDLDTRRTRKEVVDGQQRTTAIIEYLDNKYALSRGDYQGKRFRDLDDLSKMTLLDYTISADVFTSATEEEIREVFRRINSYQVPLNKQETRHATHQGEFKWFIRDLGARYATSFVKMGAMVERQISRMADLELLTELVQAIVNGIKTSSPRALDKLYADNDKIFVDREKVERQLEYGLGEIIDLVDIHKTNLVTRPNLYALFAAFVAIQFPQSPLRDQLEASIRDKPFTDRADILTNLTTLADVLEDDSAEPPLSEFISAARQGTNTERNRRTRFTWFHRSLTVEPPLA
jgi:hypothetical protein